MFDFKKALALAIVWQAVASQPAAAQISPEAPPEGAQVVYMGAHPFVAPAWRSASVYHCPNRDVGFTIETTVNKRTTISELALGAASSPSNENEINARLGALQFDKVIVTCGPGNAASMLFLAWGERPDGSASRRSISISSPSMHSPEILIEEDGD